MWIAAVCTTLPRLDQRQLGRAAADVDVEQRRARGRATPWRRPSRRPRASTPCGVPAVAQTNSPPISASTSAIALRVLAPQRLAGEDHRAGVDVVGMDAGAS